MASENSGSLRTKSTAAPTFTRIDDGLITVRYEETVAAKPPIAVTVAPPRAPPTDTHPAFRRRPISGLENKDLSKRDSGLAPTTSSKAREGSVNTVDESMANILGISIDFNSAPPDTANGSAPETTVHAADASQMVNSESGRSGSTSRRKSSTSRKGSNPKSPNGIHASTPEEDFSPITIPIPTDRLLEEDFLDQLSFSKRGSMMLGGKKAVNGHARANGGRRQPSFSLLVSPSPKALSDELELESQKVRSMYESGCNYDWHQGINHAIETPAPVDEAEEEEKPNGLLSPSASQRPTSSLSSWSESPAKKEHELAGGIEDWEDVSGNDVDRYGFINLRRNTSRPGTPEPRPPQRVSTLLQLASETPRRKRTLGRSPSSSSNSPFKNPSRKKPAKSLKTQNTQVSIMSRRSTRSGIRAAANHLPGNRDRRWMDEAGDMLTLPPGLADIAEDEEGGKAADGLKKKEWERSEKWRKMAKVTKSGTDGEGMEFEFDTRNPRLIERTWKGIPDRWRAAAWYSFLRTSAKKRKESTTEEQIIEAFHQLQQSSSADDVQIDIDVPRTINSHIMFRRRYRGGQRLLFRVLHALSLYFPDTGYVQGMASLAATLLCYYDEEKTFVMLTRMWTLRGLDKLYESGFPGLMAALDEFEKQWLVGGEISKKLEELNIEPTAYGTRWYLTLFNYSIPFPAQLRVWDVFMLLGDSDIMTSPTKERPFAGGLDILHATSAALIDGLREILLDSDFENAMKVLTSWVPVKDEELLMRVAKAEWKLHHGKNKN